MSWERFETALAEYRDAEYHGRSRNAGENAYLHVFDELAGLPIAERDIHADSIIQFLNVWACHFPTRTPNTRTALRSWINREASSLQGLVDLSITDLEGGGHRAECERLYASLLDLQSVSNGPSIPTMDHAAASKILHLMIPPLFVMWDTKIKKGELGYGDFLIRMHELALELHRRAPAAASSDLEAYLQRTLGYPVCKPLAKYIDEYNWWLAWGPAAAALIRSGLPSGERPPPVPAEPVTHSADDQFATNAGTRMDWTLSMSSVVAARTNASHPSRFAYFF